MKKNLINWFLYGSLAVIAIIEIRYWSDSQSQFHNKANNLPSKVFVSVSRGERRKIDLPDGSTVWLNAASTLSYPSDMADGNRHIELVGEGFFDVIKDAKHPFSVKLGDMSLEVLGTRFNLRGYPEESAFQAFVTSGAIKVRYNDQELTLHSGEIAEVKPGQLQGTQLNLKTGNDTSTAESWTQGLLDFTNADLRSLLRDLSRAYNVDIHLQGQAPTYRFTGTISLAVPLDQNIQIAIGAYIHVKETTLSKQRIVITVNS